MLKFILPLIALAGLSAAESPCDLESEPMEKCLDVLEGIEDIIDGVRLDLLQLFMPESLPKWQKFCSTIDRMSDCVNMVEEANDCKASKYDIKQITTIASIICKPEGLSVAQHAEQCLREQWTEQKDETCGTKWNESVFEDMFNTDKEDEKHMIMCRNLKLVGRYSDCMNVGLYACNGRGDTMAKYLSNSIATIYNSECEGMEVSEDYKPEVPQVNEYVVETCWFCNADTLTCDKVQDRTGKSCSPPEDSGIAAFMSKEECSAKCGEYNLDVVQISSDINHPRKIDIRRHKPCNAMAALPCLMQLKQIKDLVPDISFESALKMVFADKNEDRKKICDLAGEYNQCIADVTSDCELTSYADILIRRVFDVTCNEQFISAIQSNENCIRPATETDEFQNTCVAEIKKHLLLPKMVRLALQNSKPIFCELKGAMDEFHVCALDITENACPEAKAASTAAERMFEDWEARTSNMCATKDVLVIGGDDYDGSTGMSDEEKSDSSSQDDDSGFMLDDSSEDSDDIVSLLHGSESSESDSSSTEEESYNLKIIFRHEMVESIQDCTSSDEETIDKCFEPMQDFGDKILDAFFQMKNLPCKMNTILKEQCAKLKPMENCMTPVMFNSHCKVGSCDTVTMLKACEHPEAISNASFSCVKDVFMGEPEVMTCIASKIRFGDGDFNMMESVPDMYQCVEKAVLRECGQNVANLLEMVAAPFMKSDNKVCDIWNTGKINFDRATGTPQQPQFYPSLTDPAPTKMAEKIYPTSAKPVTEAHKIMKEAKPVAEEQKAGASSVAFSLPIIAASLVLKMLLV